MPFVNSLNNYLNKNFTGKCTGSVYGFWTAGRRKDKTKTFYWNTAKPSIYAFNTCDCGKVANILNWASGQPDDYMSNEDCVHMYSVDGKLIANDFPCSNKVTKRKRVGSLKKGKQGLYDKRFKELTVDEVKLFQYNSSVAANDIALIKLSEPLTFNKTVQPICLAQPNIVEAYDVCVLTGHGKTDPADGKSSSQLLLQGKMNVMTHSECLASYVEILQRGENEFNVTYEKQFCAGLMPAFRGINPMELMLIHMLFIADGCILMWSPFFFEIGLADFLSFDGSLIWGTGDNDYAISVMGDSGGPLMCRNSRFQWTQIGVVSYCDDSKIDYCPISVFTRVSYYYKALMDAMK
ncbi:hypothetical protein HELRODRAFT_179263 [Helobdella robusta]|uniref:Peptidase S1 domain-containing protein n=1 Tax=Helobdella robusta TaxID=6412 RepID=T1FEG3_HELRO|nr:hypothetical protein HELRODRAFT_179263 [Helobdella robusta]ESN95492.1 hypothetical protein HELRODRAFT_179263 [Helobdella robusta]